ncbi:MAG: hypothetical protein CM15mP108_2980 [Gammaproteobacteria bacterium]|nr:MAG: hypothetical protein CM15mP108_2980 [Gammaproteobacteria bacterium]
MYFGGVCVSGLNNNVFHLVTNEEEIQVGKVRKITFKVLFT